MQPAFPPDVRRYDVLADGTEVIVRPIGAQDRALLARGFAQLGPASRYQRFFTLKRALSEDELRFLTDLDGVHHYALGAVTWDELGHEQPLGSARYVRADPFAEVAEAAVTVIDAMQRRGLGKRLLQALARAARERGVRRFRCDVLADNTRVHHLMRGIDAQPRLVMRELAVETFELSLPPGTTPAWAVTRPRTIPFGRTSCL